MAQKILEIETPIVPISSARRFIVECMQAAGTPNEFAETIADNLVEADYRGHYSHGMNRLEMYVKDIKSGVCACAAEPSVIQENAATAWVDGNNGLGAVVGLFSMELAIKKAKDVGIGMVVAKGSNHYGIAGIYALQAIKEGLIGMSFTNTSPLMAPTRAKDSALGTNPLSLGAPAKCQDSFLLDMATTAVAVGKIEMHKRDNTPIPEGWAQDSEGKITTDASVAYDARRLMPLGGAEYSSGYKGFGLNMLVEILSGILSGSAYGPHVRKWGDSGKPANIGHCFIAIDPKCFAPDFEHRLTDLMGYIRTMEPIFSCQPVMVAGDKEKLHMASVDESGGVRYLPNQLDACKALAESLNIKPLLGKEAMEMISNEKSFRKAFYL